jgi:hypothetical protein
MTDDERLRFTLEVINGDWALLSFILMLMCAFYLVHELLARHMAPWRTGKWAQGMRVATAIMAISAGVAITRVVIFWWRHFYDASEFSHLQAAALIAGAAIGTVGFICAIREISHPLYGHWPWIVSMVLLAIMTAYTVSSRFY